jgi:outer membrane protein OmpA-like peptidoglycan-associated protein
MLTLTGTSDGKERESEKERLILAEQRAKNIKDYLVNRWNINPNIITIKTRDIPELPTSEAYVEGFEENRRVEISSNSPDILAPVIHSKFLEFTSKQESINVNAILNDCDLLAWEFSLTDKNNNEIFKSNRFGRTRGYRGYNFNIKIPVNQIFIDEAGQSISSNDNLHYLFKVTNISNKKESKEGGLKINLATNQYEVGRLNLIVFDFDKSDISTLNKKLINDFIKSSIQKNSIVRITGGTDRLGESTYNKKLSIERAHTARKFLLSIQPDINITEIKGKGASDLKYNNDLPEGRFYCRTVMIEIKTPVK